MVEVIAIIIGFTLLPAIFFVIVGFLLKNSDTENDSCRPEIRGYLNRKK